jgi:hypothetical protein
MDAGAAIRPRALLLNARVPYRNPVLRFGFDELLDLLCHGLGDAGESALRT